MKHERRHIKYCHIYLCTACRCHSTSILQRDRPFEVVIRHHPFGEPLLRAPLTCSCSAPVEPPGADPKLTRPRWAWQRAVRRPLLHLPHALKVNKRLEMHLKAWKCIENHLKTHENAWFEVQAPLDSRSRWSKPVDPQVLRLQSHGQSRPWRVRKHMDIMWDHHISFHYHVHLIRIHAIHLPHDRAWCT